MNYATRDDSKNPLGLRGIDRVEIATRDPEPVRLLMRGLGFSRTRRHRTMHVDVWRQNDVRFLVTSEPNTFAWSFAEAHGPSIASLVLRVDEAPRAFAEAVRRGARPFEPSPNRRATIDAPAIYGVGDSLLYFVDPERGAAGGFEREYALLETPDLVMGRGFVAIDHLTNNVEKGELPRWASFYKDILGFTEVRAFDIRGNKTGLYSYALRSPCGTFCIPINEDKGDTGQIAEYLREYKGAGIQHIALLTNDLLGSLDAMGDAVPTLDIDADYYAEAFRRVPNVREDKARIMSHDVLVDGDAEGYLLQIFTKNCIGPVFFEMIQRENHASFGEGNFSALFRSIERDQEKRGVI
jgi:4-hydroxyphenylpyruvate dioxygenase